jgi:hypothetical protein
LQLLTHVVDISPYFIFACPDKWFGRYILKQMVTQIGLSLEIISLRYDSEFDECSKMEISMKKQLYAVSILSAAVFLSACEGDDGVNGQNGADGTDGLNSLVVVRDLPVGDADCLGGGQALDSGLDSNRNDVLDPEEVTATDFLSCAVTPTLRALHASPDAPAVNIVVDGAEALSGVDFAQGSGFLGVGQAENVTETAADVSVIVNAITPGGEVEAINADLSLEFGSETTVIATGTVANDGLLLPVIAVTNPIGAPITDGSFRAQVVHGSPSAPPVNVYVTALDAPLDAPVNPLPLAFGDFTPQLEVPAGDYQIRIAVPGTPPTVVYDSGEIPLAAGADLLIVAVDNVGIGDSAVQLVVLDGTAAAPLYDAATGAAAVAVHLSQDAPAVDILADIGSTEEVEALKLVENVSYTQACVIENIPAPETFTLSVVATGDTTSVLDIPYVAGVNEGTTIVVSGLIATDSLQAIPLAVDPRSIATEAKLRLTHGSPATPNVDIYLLPAGGNINTSDPAFTDVPFGADTGVLSIAPDTYDVYVTATGSKVPAISVPGFILSGGDVLDVVARDATDAEMGPQPLVIDYETLDACVVAP